MGRVGIVLGAGGATGHGFHVGALAALEDVTGFDARTAGLMVGTSSGAPVAALVRAGVSGIDLAGRACGEPPSARLLDMVARRGARPARTAPRRLVAPFTVGPPASLRGLWAAARRPGRNRLGAMVSAFLPAGSVPVAEMGGPVGHLFDGGWPTEPLFVCAVHLASGQRVVFGACHSPATDVATAVAASSAIPAWFRPVVIDRDRYVDGAAWSSTNADVASGEKLDVVIVISPMTTTRWSDITANPTGRLHHRYLNTEIDGLRRQGVIVVVVEPTAGDSATMGPNRMDGRRSNAVIRQVRASLRDRLDHGDLTDQLPTAGLT